jgi:hypothetical protein
MVLYTCDKCKKDFNHKSVFTKHIYKKRSCTLTIANKNNMCKKCNKQFSSYMSLYSHTKNKVCNKKQVDATSVNNNTINNNTINNNMKVDGDMKLVKFGNENLSYISDDLFKSILGRGFKSVEELVDHSHFHPDHPENHNIYIANIKNDYVVIYDGKKWNINKKEDVFEDIIYAKSDFLCMKFKELMGQMTETDIKKFTNFINERDEDKTMNKIKGELKLQLYNNRYLPERLRKQMEATERILLKDLNKKQPKRSKKSAMSALDNIMNMLDSVDESKVKDVEALLNKILV